METKLRTPVLRTPVLGTAALALAALILSPLAPASAESVEIPDARDLDHGVDLRSVAIRHHPDNIVVRTVHTDLIESYRSGSSGVVFLDTDPANTGPEYVFVGGYFVGTDYNLLTTDGFATKKWGEPVEGSYRMKVDYDRETVRFRISRDAIGSPGAVRVAVRVAGTRPNGRDTAQDWLDGPRNFTDWVAQ